MEIPHENKNKKIHYIHNKQHIRILFVKKPKMHDLHLFIQK